MDKIKKPTFIVNKSKVISNTLSILKKIAASEGTVRFRPHFKTHQSVQVSEWLKPLGITSITVSSLDMALLFSQHGWNDISVAILVNPLQIDQINFLAERIHLSLLVDSKTTALWLEKELKHPVNVWIKIDTGYHRTGIEWSSKEEILSLSRAIANASKLNLKGLLTHSGHSYHADTTDDIESIYLDTVSKMKHVKQTLLENNIKDIQISLGDTPTCSIMKSFNGIDEIRCGNFVYYDVQHLMLGVIEESQIAAALACPVIGIYPMRNEIVIYGGAVHLSKDRAIDWEGRDIYGLVAPPLNTEYQWGSVLEKTYVKSLSQEHGVIKTTPQVIEKIKTGDLLMILPPHACLTANLMKENTLYC